jgi:Holliday junction DNA helicase RuvA
LKEKVSDLVRTQGSGKSAKSHWRTQLQSALIGLGFTARDAEATIDSVASDLGAKIDETDISELLKLALQNRGRG